MSAEIYSITHVYTTNIIYYLTLYKICSFSFKVLAKMFRLAHRSSSPRLPEVYPKTSPGAGISKLRFTGGSAVLLGPIKLVGRREKALSKSVRGLVFLLLPVLLPRSRISWFANGLMSNPRRFPFRITEHGLWRFLNKYHIIIVILQGD